MGETLENGRTLCLFLYVLIEESLFKDFAFVVEHCDIVIYEVLQLPKVLKFSLMCFLNERKFYLIVCHSIKILIWFVFHMRESCIWLSDVMNYLLPFSLYKLIWFLHSYIANFVLWKEVLILLYSILTRETLLL